MHEQKKSSLNHVYFLNDDTSQKLDYLVVVHHKTERLCKMGLLCSQSGSQ